MASRSLATVIVVAYLLTSVADAYVLPDDVIPRSPANYHHHNHQHHHQQQQEGGGKVMNGDAPGGGQLDVTVTPEYTLMYRRRQITVNCTATASKERPYVSFFVSTFYFSASTLLPAALR